MNLGRSIFVNFAIQPQFLLAGMKTRLRWRTIEPGGGFKKFCTEMLKVDFRISTISIPQEAWFCDPSYQIATKTPNLEQIGCFFSQIFQHTPNFGSGTETHPSIYQTWRKITLKPLSIPVYHRPVRTPPPPGKGENSDENEGNHTYGSRLERGYMNMTLVIQTPHDLEVLLKRRPKTCSS